MPSYDEYYLSGPAHYSVDHNRRARQDREGNRSFGYRDYSNDHSYPSSTFVPPRPPPPQNYLSVPSSSSRGRAGSSSSSYNGVDTASRRSPTNAQRSDAKYPYNEGHAFMVFESERLQSVAEESTTPHGILRPSLVCPDTNPTKRHRCPQCNKGFDRPSALETHKTSHTKKQPYLCPACDKAFGVKSNMTRHYKKVHNDERSSNASVYSHTTRGSSSERSISPYDYCSPAEHRRHY